MRSGVRGDNLEIPPLLNWNPNLGRLTAGGGTARRRRPRVDAMRWEVANPWAAVLEKLSTHPLVARRIQALEESGLPGAPRRWSIARSLASIVPHDRRSVRRAAVADGALAISPWLVLIAAVAIGAGFQSRLSVGLALVTAGGLLLAKQARKYPDDFAPSEVTPLLSRLDASPVAGIPVELRGELIGRADAGNLLSPDLVLQDSTGFVPLARFSLVPLGRHGLRPHAGGVAARQRGRGPRLVPPHADAHRRAARAVHGRRRSVDTNLVVASVLGLLGRCLGGRPPRQPRVSVLIGGFTT